MRSSIGPDNRPTYARFAAAEHVHEATSDASPPREHGHGLAARSSRNRAGYVATPRARVIVTEPASSGWRRASRARRENSGASSRNSTPR